ncbi:MAG: flagellar protein FlaG [Gammaproteobacteria bacterium]|jgi:flagellar protein FlaG|nr:flagellar protein FlaG [Gammaproteobacteria bacterium]MBT3725082.1 flagellar protein FlaG [Gammaproteobacteria bacterium]MBT4076115.1 flagellar protein FlaG [Gammaproteobacteria bacterium]MBT4194402.1 flagellar protein FlaG [Gammaproteobacteria bacterium]MBT4448454.1 flagellar protein FlaG [Gammaproteobacteria bacterium]
MVSEITNKAVIPNQTQPKTNVVDFKLTQSNKADEVSDESIPLKPASSVEESVDSQEMESTANRLNEIAQDIRRDLEFKVDDNSGDMVITVLDRETNEVIRQIPQEHVLALRENMESLKGILFSAKI